MKANKSSDAARSQFPENHWRRPSSPTPLLPSPLARWQDARAPSSSLSPLPAPLDTVYNLPPLPFHCSHHHFSSPSAGATPLHHHPSRLKRKRIHHHLIPSATTTNQEDKDEAELQRLPRPAQGLQRGLQHPPLPPVDQEPRRAGQRHRLPRQVLRPCRPHEPHQRRTRKPQACHLPVPPLRGLRPHRQPHLRLRRPPLVRQLADVPGRRRGRPQGRPHRPDLLRGRRRQPHPRAPAQGLRHPPRLQDTTTTSCFRRRRSSFSSFKGSSRRRQPKPRPSPQGRQGPPHPLQAHISVLHLRPQEPQGRQAQAAPSPGERCRPRPSRRGRVPASPEPRLVRQPRRGAPRRAGAVAGHRRGGRVARQPGRAEHGAGRAQPTGC